MKFMKMPSNVRISKFLVTSILCWWAVAGMAQEKESTGFVADKIIAKVDNYIILRSELDGAYQNYLANGGTASEASRCGLFSQMVINKVLVAKAEID